MAVSDMYELCAFWKICKLEKAFSAKHHNFYLLWAKLHVTTLIYLAACRLLSAIHLLFDLTGSEKSNCFSDL